jgi:glycosyltransferase involved in cell wall biosynthesis
LHVLHSMNCGGVEALLMNLLRCADRDKLRFDFLVHVPDEMYYEPELRRLGCEVYRLPALRQLGPVRYARALLDFFRTHPEMQIVHSHLETTTGLILRQARRAGVPVRIAHSHNTRFPRAGPRALPENLLKQWCRRWVVPCATHRLACSREAARWLFGPAEAEIFPNGVDTARFRFSPEMRERCRAERGIPPEARVLLHVGRFQAQKNHSFLLGIWADSAPEHPDDWLLLLGDGELRPETEALAQGLPGADRICFLGQRSDVPAWLSAADVFLLPSLFEGLPVSLAEAQAAGLPCLVSDRVPLDAFASRVRQIPLGAAAPWAAALAELRPAQPAERAAAPEAVAALGYDIRASLRRLEEIYSA